MVSMRKETEEQKVLPSFELQSLLCQVFSRFETRIFLFFVLFFCSDLRFLSDVEKKKSDLFYIFTKWILRMFMYISEIRVVFFSSLAKSFACSAR